MSEPVKCSNCVWCRAFKPRPDEVERHLVDDAEVGLSCQKPGYEGYTSDAHPACDGAFFCPIVTLARTSQPEGRK